MIDALHDPRCSRPVCSPGVEVTDQVVIRRHQHRPRVDAEKTTACAALNTRDRRRERYLRGWRKNGGER